MYIRYNTNTNKIVYIGEQKPINADTDLHKVAEYNGEIPKNDWLTVGNIKSKTRIVKEAYDEIIEFNENGEPLEEPQTIHHEAIIETYLECTGLTPHFRSEAYIIKQEKIKRIAELKNLLNETDYQAIKYAEGHFSDEEYQPIKEQRQNWRDEINQLQSQII